MIYVLLATSGILNGIAQLLWKLGLAQGFSFTTGRIWELLSNPYFMGGC